MWILVRGFEAKSPLDVQLTTSQSSSDILLSSSIKLRLSRSLTFYPTILSRSRVPAERIEVVSFSTWRYFLAFSFGAVSLADLPVCFAAGLCAVSKNFLNFSYSSADAFSYKMLFVNVIPCAHLLTQGASGIGASIYFKLNSPWTTSSSTFGIILGGLMNGIENESRITKAIVPVCDSLFNKLFEGNRIVVG